MKEFLSNNQSDVSDLPQSQTVEIFKKKIEKYRKLFLSRTAFKLRNAKIQN